MMRLVRLRAAGPLLVVLGALACDAPNTTLPVPGSAARITAPQPTLGAEITALITSGFPKGDGTAISARWDQVLRSIAKEPKVTLKGKLVPGSGGRAELVKAVKYIDSKTSVSTPPTGETQAHYVARLVLDMSLYVYSGPTTPVPTVAPASDVVLKVVQPTTTDTVVTPAQQAAVIFPAGAVSEPTVVVITPDSAYYPANCSGPLDTHLCQYPKFYHFNVFPDVKLAVPAKVQVCHVDAGTHRLPLADHDRFRIAHEKPALPADYSAGSTIVDNVEILALAVMNVTTCTASGGTDYTPPPIPISTVGSWRALGHASDVAHMMLHRVSVAARKLLVPNDVYAIDVGGGGFADEFSMFGVVDPSSTPDLAQSTTSPFSLGATTFITGAVVSVPGWSVSNVGSGTSTAFTSSVIIATDSLMTAPVTTYVVGGAASLVPQASFSYPTLSVTMPSAAGTYFVGTKVSTTGADSSASDNLVSVRVVVSSPAVLVPQIVGAAPWTGAGNGTVTATVNNPTSVTLGYDFYYPEPPLYDQQTWTYTTNAVASGNVTFDWTYNGFHSYFEISEGLEAYANGPAGPTVISLASGSCPESCPSFSYNGTITLPLIAGYTWGIRASGRNYDYSRTLQGTITLTNPVIIP